MKGFKDFLHSTNDIALAIIIVLIAAGLITWRFRIIMQYPAQMAKEAAASNNTQTEQTQDTSASDDSADQSK